MISVENHYSIWNSLSCTIKKWKSSRSMRTAMVGYTGFRNVMEFLHKVRSGVRVKTRLPSTRWLGLRNFCWHGTFVLSWNLKQNETVILWIYSSANFYQKEDKGGSPILRCSAVTRLHRCKRRKSWESGLKSILVLKVSEKIRQRQLHPAVVPASTTLHWKHPD